MKVDQVKNTLEIHYYKDLITNHLITKQSINKINVLIKGYNFQKGFYKLRSLLIRLQLSVFSIK